MATAEEFNIPHTRVEVHNAYVEARINAENVPGAIELLREAVGIKPGNVRVEPFIPQAEVLARATALVCHGGSGMLGGLAAGFPMVITPLFADQHDNALGIEEAGAEVAVSGDDDSALRQAIERVLVDTQIPVTAKRIAEEMAALLMRRRRN